MLIRITERTAWVEDLEEFGSFDVATAIRGADLDAAVTSQRLGGVDPDGAHLWLDPGAVVRIADRERDERWKTAFGAMVQYAVTRSWTDSEGRVRAHLA